MVLKAIKEIIVLQNWRNNLKIWSHKKSSNKRNLPFRAKKELLKIDKMQKNLYRLYARGESQTIPSILGASISCLHKDSQFYPRIFSNELVEMNWVEKKANKQEKQTKKTKGKSQQAINLLLISKVNKVKYRGFKKGREQRIVSWIREKERKRETDRRRVTDAINEALGDHHLLFTNKRLRKTRLY